MDPNRKKYHLAVAFTRYPALNKPQLNRDHPAENTVPSSMKANIFNNNFETRLRKLQMEESKNYEIVGFKELQEISFRLERKKRIVQSGTKSSKKTFYPRPSITRNTPEYLTKEEVIREFSPQHLTASLTSRSKEQTLRTTPKKEENDYRTNTKTHKKKGDAHCGHKGDAHCGHKSVEFSVARLRSKMQDYQSGWNKQIQHRRRLIKRPHHQISSVLQSVDQYRVISEDRQKLALQQKLRNMSPSLWEKILRSPNKDPSSICKKLSNVCTSIQLKNLGRGKYKKELFWLQQKDKNGYFFKKDKNLIRHNISLLA